MNSSTIFWICSLIFLASWGLASLVASKQNNSEIKDNITITYMESTVPQAADDSD
ncbi:MAG: hypothetical protein ACK5NG_04745 [Chthoniobacterales bacterium]